MADFNKTSRRTALWVNLRGPEDWDEWLSFVHSSGTRKRVWKYVDPAVPEEALAKPPREPGPRPELELDEENRELDADQIQAAVKTYNLRLEIWKAREEPYKEWLGAMDSFAYDIFATVDDRYMAWFEDKTDLANLLRTLQARLKPPSYAFLSSIEKKLKDLTEDKSTIKKLGLRAWLDKYEDLLTKAIRYEILGYEANEHQLRRVLDALEPIDRGFTDLKRDRYLRNPLANNYTSAKPNGIEVLATFRHHAMTYPSSVYN